MNYLSVVASPAKRTAHQIKSSREWQAALWHRWPSLDAWPETLDVYEAAALLRVHPDTLRRAMVTGRDGRARLAHSRLGAVIRLRKSEVLRFGRVEGR